MILPPLWSPPDIQPDPLPPPHATPALVETAAQQPDPVAEAGTYAIVHPRRARLVRHCGGLPADRDFGPTEPELVQAIVTGTSPALRALDAPRAAAAA